MGEYHIQGKTRLTGEVAVYRSKNAVLPMFAAAVLNGGKSILHNYPQIQDTVISIQALEHIGCTVATEGRTVIVDSSGANCWSTPVGSSQITVYIKIGNQATPGLSYRFTGTICGGSSFIPICA